MATPSTNRPRRKFEVIDGGGLVTAMRATLAVLHCNRDSAVPDNGLTVVPPATPAQRCVLLAIEALVAEERGNRKNAHDFLLCIVNRGV